MAVVVVGAFAHHVELISVGAVSVIRIVRVIEIRQSESVGEFVAGRADPADFRTPVTVELGRAEIVLDPHAVIHRAVPGQIAVGQVPGVRPDTRPAAPLCFVVTGEIIQDEIHLAVAVIVIAREVDVRVQLLDGVDQRHLRTQVISGGIVGPVIGHRRIQPHRSEHVENGRERTQGILLVIIQDGTDGPAHGIALLIKQCVKFSGRLGEGLVLESDQEDGDAGRARVRGCTGGGAAALVGGTAAHGCLPARRLGRNRLRRLPITVQPLYEHIALLVGHPVPELVSMEIGHDRTAIRLGPDDTAPVGGCGGKRPDSGQGQKKCKQNLLHSLIF